ncbi:MAG: hypothetical protein KJ655_04775 [Candidatus Thermoplasmatota archaeon]|nr:hypothetical protein [Candidatus Thermoplasmatota archaeon]
MVKAIKYKLEVFSGVLAWTHGFGGKIEEIYIPSEDIAFNLHGEGNVFKTDKNRYKDAEKINELQLDKDTVEILKDYLKMKERITDTIRAVIAGKPKSRVRSSRKKKK